MTEKRFAVGDRVVLKSPTRENFAFHLMRGVVLHYDAANETPSIFLVELENKASRFCYYYELARDDGSPEPSAVEINMETIIAAQKQADELVAKANDLAQNGKADMSFIIVNQSLIEALRYKLVAAVPYLIRQVETLTAERDDARAVLGLVQTAAENALPEGDLFVADLQLSLEEIRALCIGQGLKWKGSSDE